MAEYFERLPGVMALMNCQGCGKGITDASCSIRTDGGYWHLDCAKSVLSVTPYLLGTYVQLLQEFQEVADMFNTGRIEQAREQLHVTATKLHNFTHEKIKPLIAEWEERQEVEANGRHL